MKVLCVLFSLWMFGSLAMAQSGCQGQTCDFSRYPGCFRCRDQYDMACSVDARERCGRSCTITVCNPNYPYPGGAACPKVDDKKLASLRNPRLILASLQAESSSSDEGPHTAFTFFPGTKDDPVSMISVTNNADRDLFEEGQIRNNDNDAAMTGFQIGYLVYPSDPQAQVVERKSEKVGSISVNGAFGVLGGTVLRIGAQRVPPGLLKDAKLIVFYIAAAEFSNGTTWKANTEQIKALYRGK